MAEQINDMNVESVITKDPQILGGTPVFVGTRVPFEALVDYMEGGRTLDEFRMTSRLLRKRWRLLRWSKAKR